MSTATTSLAAASLKDLTWAKLLRKAYDLLSLKERNATTISKLKGEVVTLEQEVTKTYQQSQNEVGCVVQQLKEKDVSIHLLKENHEKEMMSERSNHSNRIKAIKSLHIEEKRKSAAEHCDQCRMATDNRKASNVVITLILLFTCCL